jgi:hypothetical protein
MILIMEKLEATIQEMIDVDGKSEEDIFEMVNKILIKCRKRNIRGKKPLNKKRKVVCRPVLLISDSSCDE